MYAVIETGGKQYRVTEGDTLDVELLADAPKAGETLSFERVLMIGGDGDPQIGDPLVAGATVDAEVVGRVRAPKIRVFKMKRRKGYRRTRGHRQDLHRVRISSITS